MTKETAIKKSNPAFELLQRAQKGYAMVDPATVFDCKMRPSSKIVAYTSPCKLTPEKMDEFYFSPGVMRDIMAWFICGDQKEALWLTGPTGAGKSELVRQICNRLNYGLIHAVGHDRMEAPDLTLTMLLSNGSTVPVAGPVPKAMLEGHILLIDEVDAMSPATNMILHEVAQGKDLYIQETGMRIKPAPGFRLIVTANTNGGGDRKAHYLGTMKQNLAFAERFFFVEVNYLPAAEEVKVLKKHFPDVHEEFLAQKVEVANMIRKSFMGEPVEITIDGKTVNHKCEITFSTRALIRWQKYSDYFKGMKADEHFDPQYNYNGKEKNLFHAAHHAVHQALALRAGRPTQEFVHACVDHVLGV